ncbi:MAG TPA: hypothetical protein VLA61_07410 [Ideonella sp.]|uniref:hypothetical protein n=1 Tax=Ideonella sp. TaxID=1929293 RepID=UPI002C2664B5|nr:hypothetical protein [Ideonella sp.]HSI48079.1 hypothetical protein [Ideonella sp.]
MPTQLPSRFLAWVFAVMTLAGCATPPQSTVAASRPVPSMRPDQTKAVLVGESAGGMLNGGIFAVSINDKPVKNSPATATEPISLEVGKTKLITVLRAGVFVGSTVLSFDAAPNTTYRIRAAQDTDKPWYQQQIYAAGGDTFFWIENYDTGEIVSEKVKVFVKSSANSAVFIPLIQKK